MTSHANNLGSYHSSLMVESTRYSQITNCLITVQVLAYLLSNYLEIWSGEDNEQINVEEKSNSLLLSLKVIRRHLIELNSDEFSDHTSIDWTTQSCRSIDRNSVMWYGSDKDN